MEYLKLEYTKSDNSVYVIFIRHEQNVWHSYNEQNERISRGGYDTLDEAVSCAMKILKTPAEKDLPSFDMFSSKGIIKSLQVTNYVSNNSLAVLASILWEDGEESQESISINLCHEENSHASNNLPASEFYAKDFEEKEAIFYALLKAGWIQEVSNNRPRSGFCTYAHCRLTDKAIISKSPA